MLENPVLGIGADSTPAVKAKAVTAPEKPEGFVFRRTTGQHAHNLFLQSWYELGCSAPSWWRSPVPPLRRLLLLPLEAQAYGAAAFTLFAVIAAFAWGMWQVWLVCAIGLLPLYLLMPAALLRAAAGATMCPRLDDDKLRRAGVKRMPKDARLTEAWPGGQKMPAATETLKETSMQKYLIAGLLWQAWCRRRSPPSSMWRRAQRP